jgi:hypothetical protein
MNWHKFLKPDWKKVIIISIGTFMFLLFQIHPDSVDASGNGASPFLDILATFLFIVPLYISSLFIKNQGIGSSVLIWILTLIFLYVVSCVVVYIDNNRKKK